MSNPLRNTGEYKSYTPVSTPVLGGSMGLEPEMPGPTESTSSQSVRIRLASGLIIALAVIGLTAMDHRPKQLDEFIPAWVPGLFDRLVDGVIVFASAAFFSETAWFKTFLEQRIGTHLVWLLKSDFADRIENDGFLRHLGPQALERAEDAIRRASFAQDMPEEVDTFHRALKSIRNRLDVWRADYREHMAIEPVAHHPELVRIVVQTHWVYVNYSAERKTKEFVQRLTEQVAPIPGIPDEDLYRTTRLVVGGVDVTDRAAVTHNPQGSFRYFHSEVQFDLPPSTCIADGVPFESTTEFIRLRKAPYITRFFHPVHKFNFTCHFPANLEATMHVFGVGSLKEQADPLTPRDKFKNQHTAMNTWDYDGWLLPNHGLFITFIDCPVKTT